MKKFLSLLLACLMVSALALPAMAVEETEETTAPVETAAAAEEGIEPHASCNGNHTWVYSYTTSKVVSQGASGHATVTTTVYECNVCGVLDSTVRTEATTSHSLSTYLVSHRHLRGTTHSATWRDSCGVCGYSKTYTTTYTCPGNVNGEGCILP